MNLFSGKVDPKLQIAVYLTEEERNVDKQIMAGYKRETKSWKLIVKYSGDIIVIAAKYGADAEVLTEKYAIVTIKENMLLSFIEEPNIEFIEKPKNLNFNLKTSLTETFISQVNNYPQYNLKGEGVLIGIIDSGIDFLHPDFIDEDNKSRILYIWDQSISGNSPEGFLNGHEYTNEDLNEAIELNIQGKDSTIRHFDFIGHGTHVAGIAAGNGRASKGLFTGVAPMSKLIIVKMGSSDFKGYPINNIDVMLGVKYLIEKAKKLNMPIAINLSYGTDIGPHDGNSVFESYMDEMALQWKNAIVVSIGNEANAGRHTHGNVKQGRSEQFIIEGDITSVTIDIWKTQLDFFNVELVNPRGISTGVVPYQTNNLRYTIGNERIFIRINKSTPFSYLDNISIELIAVNQYLSEGIWTIIFHSNYVIDGAFNIWLFTQEKNTTVKFLTPHEQGTFTLPSTSRNVISVGGYDGTTGKLSSFSGRGFEGNISNRKPDICAPAERIMSTIPGGGYDALTGTSMAAPFVTGASALLMQWGIVNKNDPYLYGQSLKGYLLSGAKREKNIQYPNSSWGYGKLCLLNTMDILTGIVQLRYRESNESESPSEIEQKIASEDFIDLIAEYNSNLIKAANSSKDIVIGKQIQSGLAVIYVKDSLLDYATSNLNISIDLSYPLLYNLTDEESLVDANILPLIINPNINLRGNGVIIGMIDTGIDYTHPAFRYEDGTSKILYIWDQTINTGNPPPTYKYGTEYTNEQINEALKAENPFDVVPSNDTVGHGTFLAGVAAGRNEGTNMGVAQDAKLIVVKVRPAKKNIKESYMIFNDVLVYQQTDLVQANMYLLEKADELNMPLSVCHGFATNQGGHDGVTYVITGAKIGVAFVASGGNEGNARKHLKGSIEREGQNSTIELNVAENEKGTVVYIWGYSPDKFSVSIISPGGEIIEKVPVKNTVQERFRLIFYNTTIWVNYYVAVSRSGDELCVIRIKNPQSGLWKIIVHGEYITNGNFHAWLPAGNLSDKNTFFLDSSPDYTITDLGNSNQIICVTAYNHINQHLFIDSGRGPTRYGTIRPDLTAPGVNIRGPAVGGGFTTLSGSSVAVAHVAGAAAIILQWAIVNKNFSTINGNIIKSFLIQGARRHKGIEYPNNQYGYGQLDLLNTFKEMSTIQFKNQNNFFIDDTGLRKAIEKKEREYDGIVLAMVLFDDLRSCMNVINSNRECNLCK